LWIAAVLATTYYFRTLMIAQADNYLHQYSDLVQYTFGLVVDKSPDLRRVEGKPIREQRKTLDPQRVHIFPGLTTTPAVNLWFTSTPVVVGDGSPVLPPPVEPGYRSVELETDGMTSIWRILYTHDIENRFWLAVAVDLENMDYFGVITLRKLLLPLLILVPVMLAFLVWGVTNGLKPLRTLASRIQTRGPSQLDPIEISQTPKEMEPVVSSINGLMEELRRALDNEKRFTANAAHELKTTLATIQAEIQRFQQISNQGEEVEELLGNIYVRTNRASKTLTQLLQLARLDSVGQIEYTELELNSLINEEIVDLAALALDRKLEVDIQGLDEPVWLKANEDLLRILFRNLILNAFTYSSFAGEVYISLKTINSTVEFEISNDCQSLSEPELEFVSTRFYRGKTAEVHGSGLGLSIVQRIAQLHHANITLSAWRSGRGFQAVLRFDRLPIPARPGRKGNRRRR